MKTEEITIEKVDKMVDGLSETIRYLYAVGEFPFKIGTIQSFLGQALVAQKYLMEGKKVWWIYPEADLKIEDIGTVEVKSAKMWEDGSANIFNVKVAQFDVLCIVVLKDGKTVQKIISIPEKELEGLPNEHKSTAGNGKHPFLWVYTELALKQYFAKGREIYDIERDIAAGKYDWQ